MTHDECLNHLLKISASQHEVLLALTNSRYEIDLGVMKAAEHAIAAIQLDVSQIPDTHRRNVWLVAAFWGVTFGSCMGTNPEPTPAELITAMRSLNELMKEVQR